MRGKKLIVVIILLVMMVGVTFAYVVQTFKSNELTIRVGTPDGATATLTALSTGVLIPVDGIPSAMNEVKKLEFTLQVDSSLSYFYSISHNLPPQFTVTTDNPQYSFMMARAYKITVTMTQPILTDQVFYIIIELIL